MSIGINARQSFCAIVAAGFFVGCASTSLPPLPDRNPANPQAPVSVSMPHSLLHDTTTLAIQNELSRTEKAAKGDMPGMQHGDLKTEGQKDAPTAAQVEQEKKAIAEEMKKTSDEMKQTSEELKKKSEQPKPQEFYYTCVMHPQIHENHPGKCPICGMMLVKKEGKPPQ